jgi:hypothetical protein
MVPLSGWCGITFQCNLAKKTPPCIVSSYHVSIFIFQIPSHYYFLLLFIYLFCFFQGWCWPTTQPTTARHDPTRPAPAKLRPDPTRPAPAKLRPTLAKLRPRPGRWGKISGQRLRARPRWDGRCAGGGDLGHVRAAATLGTCGQRRPRPRRAALRARLGEFGAASSARGGRWATAGGDGWSSARFGSGHSGDWVGEFRDDRWGPLA